MRTTSARDYPFDADLKVQDLVGLDRLRAIKDRRVAQNLYDLYWLCEHNEKRMSSEAYNAREQARKDAEDLEDLQSMAEKASGGVYGREAKRVAEEYLSRHGRLRHNLEELRRLLQRVPGRQSG